MVVVYFTPQVPASMQTKAYLRGLFTEAVSCGTIIVGHDFLKSHLGFMHWSFDGCPQVDMYFAMTDLAGRESAEVVAKKFLAEWSKVNTKEEVDRHLADLPAGPGQ